jgi:hypothetical protein
MSFLGKVRYRLGRWVARGQAYESELGNKAEWTSPFQGVSGTGLMTKEAGDDATAYSEDPADRDRKNLGTEL